MWLKLSPIEEAFMRPRDFCFETRVQENMSVNKQNKKEPSGVKKTLYYDSDHKKIWLIICSQKITSSLWLLLKCSHLETNTCKVKWRVSRVPVWWSLWLCHDCESTGEGAAVKLQRQEGEKEEEAEEEDTPGFLIRAISADTPADGFPTMFATS